jgi:hypothetical protein
MVGRRLSAARVAWVDVDVWLVDLLLADLLGDLLLGDGLGAQADPLDRDGSLATTGRSACRVTSCSSSLMAGPDSAASRLASVIGSRSSRTSSWLTGTEVVTVSVTTYLRSRARPVWTFSVPTCRRSSERVIASSVVGPEVPPRTPAGSLARSPPSAYPASRLSAAAEVAECSAGRASCSCADMPVIVDVGRVLNQIPGDSQDLVPVNREPWIGATCRVPKKPVATVIHSGDPVCSLR